MHFVVISSLHYALNQVVLSMSDKIIFALPTCLVLAVLSYYVVEKLLKNFNLKQVYTVAVVSIVVIVLICVGVNMSGGNKTSGALEKMDEYAQNDNFICFGGRALDNSVNCPTFGASNESTQLMARFDAYKMPGDVQDPNNSGVTEYGDLNSTEVVVTIGNSHMMHWAAALQEIGLKHHLKIIYTLDIAKYELPTNYHIKSVLTSWLYSNGGYSSEIDSRLYDVAEFALQHDATLIAFEDVPYYTKISADEVNLMINREVNVPNMAINDPNWKLDKRAALRTARMPFDTLDKTEITNKYKRLYTESRFCDDAFCYPTIGGVTTHIDPSHLTQTYNRTLMPWLERQLESLGGI
jgi:hypothetical protein